MITSPLLYTAVFVYVLILIGLALTIREFRKFDQKTSEPRRPARRYHPNSYRRRLSGQGYPNRTASVVSFNKNVPSRR